MNNQQPTASQRKDRLYGQLSTKLEQLKKANMKTTDLMELFQNDLDAMRTFAGIQAAQWVWASIPTDCLLD